MATLHATTNRGLLFSLTFLSVHFTLAANTTAIKPNPLKLKLHHPHNVFYKLDDTIENRADRFLSASINRLSYLFEKAAGGGDPEYDARGDLVTDRAYSYSAFFVNFSVGDPPFSQLALMDTGSDLIWVDCESLFAFDPYDSHTYIEYKCSNRDRVPCTTCSLDDECMFEIRYAGGRSTEGVMAKEKFTFETDEGKTILNDVVFGCSKDNSNTRNLMGVFGLGTLRPEYSIVKKMGSKFSYCIGNVYDKDYKYNQISLGAGTFFEGRETPLTNYNGLYYVNLEGISVGDKWLGIDPNLFSRTNYPKDGVVVDTGTSYSWLVSKAYDVLRAEIAKIGDGMGLRRQYDVDDWQLCFSGDATRDPPRFPEMTLHFENGADLVLETTSMFTNISRRAFCLTFGPSSTKGYDYLSVIGLMAQQNHHMAYDLTEKELHILDIDCSLLDED